MRAPRVAYQTRIDRFIAADTHPAYNDQGQYTAPVILLAFLIGIQSCAHPPKVEMNPQLIPTCSVDPVVCN